MHLARCTRYKPVRQQPGVRFLVYLRFCHGYFLLFIYYGCVCVVRCCVLRSLREASWCKDGFGQKMRTLRVLTTDQRSDNRLGRTPKVI